jgi:hypothetical protein
MSTPPDDSSSVQEEEEQQSTVDRLKELAEPIGHLLAGIGYILDAIVRLIQAFF